MVRFIICGVADYAHIIVLNNSPFLENAIDIRGYYAVP
jgi:hypothetical protein